MWQSATWLGLRTKYGKVRTRYEIDYGIRNMSILYILVWSNASINPSDIVLCFLAFFFYIYIYIVHAAVTLDYNSAGVCCMRKRGYDRKDRSIGDRKPDKMSSFGQCIFTLQSSTKLPALKVPGQPKSPDNTCLRISWGCTYMAGPDGGSLWPVCPLVHEWF